MSRRFRAFVVVLTVAAMVCGLYAPAFAVAVADDILVAVVLTFLAGVALLCLLLQIRIAPLSVGRFLAF